MSKIVLGLFLLVYGITVLVDTKIPAWSLGVLALIAGGLCFFEAVPRKG